MSDKPTNRAAGRKRTMTEQMLDWAVAHHEATGEASFKLDQRFRRAAGHHYHGTWLTQGYWVALRPPSIHEPHATYRIEVEVNDDA